MTTQTQDFTVPEMIFPHPDSGILPHKIKFSHPSPNPTNDVVQRALGALVGLAVGDALGASVEFRPRKYLVDFPVTDMLTGGTWGLQAGQWTDDTSMALCLASSLLTYHGFDPYDQMVRYKWWYKKGFLSSTGQCFDIGNATRASLEEFIRRQKILRQHFGNTKEEDIDHLTFQQVKSVPSFSVRCGVQGQTGNGPLMRLAPIPMFYFRQPELAVMYAGESALLTHGDKRVADACRYFAALVVAAIHGESKEALLKEDFYENHRGWFGSEGLHEEVLRVARGSYRRGGYDEGIRGKSYVIQTLEAALWAFWSDNNSFEKGACAAVNLGDDTDTTGAVYGTLAGAYYGIRSIPPRWAEQLYALDFIIGVGEWLYLEGGQIENNAIRQQVPQDQGKQAQQKALSTSIFPSKPPNPVTTSQPTTYASPAGYMGYDHPKSNSSAHYRQNQNPAPSTATKNATQQNRPVYKANGKLDPSSMPAAGKPSGK